MTDDSAKVVREVSRDVREIAILIVPSESKEHLERMAEELEWNAKLLKEIIAKEF